MEASQRLNSIWEITELIFLHPLTMHISSLSLLVKGSEVENLDDLPMLAKLSMHAMDHHVLHLINRMAEFLVTLGNHAIAIPERLIKAFGGIIKESVIQFKRCFELFIRSKDIGSFLPSFGAFNVLMHFLSPVELMELGHWMLQQVDDSFAGWISPKISPLPMALYVSGIAFDALLMNLKQKNVNKLHTLLWEERGNDDHLSQTLYLMVLDIAFRFDLGSADDCLLKAVNAAYIQKTSKFTSALLYPGISLPQMIGSSPLRILQHFINNIDKKRAKILFKLIEVSTMHLDFFGLTFLLITQEDHSDTDAGASWLLTTKKFDCLPSKESSLMMLPAALSYYTHNLMRCGRDNSGSLGAIPLFYSKILLDGIANWAQFVSMDIFHEDYEGSNLETNDLHHAFRSTLLGKSFLMLHHYFMSCQDKPNRKHRIKFFESMYSSTSVDDLLVELDVMENRTQPLVEVFNIINRIVGKISFTWLLLFPSDNLVQASLEEEKELELTNIKKEPKSEKHAKLKFLNVLTSSLDRIVKNFSVVQTNCDTDGSESQYHLLRFLELSVLQSIIKLSKRIKSCLMEFTTIPFLELFVKSSLLYRFEDPVTLRALYNILTLFQYRYSSGKFLGLLLGHSKFTSTLLVHANLSEASSLIPSGVFLQHVPSLFRAIEFSFPAQNYLVWKHKGGVKETFSELCGNKPRMELLRLVRLLFNLTIRQEGTDTEYTNLDKGELLSLLLSGYSATLSEVDREIFSFIQEIESAIDSTTGSGTTGIADVDYLWGDSALKLHREHASINAVSSDAISDPHVMQERSKLLFRDYFSIDSSLCALTALNICYTGSKHATSVPSNELVQNDVVVEDSKLQEQTNPGRTPYDPVFMLRFSIHSLMKGYIEPLEFARLGLLAVSLVSVSSPDDNLRKLGYQFLDCFQKSLMDHRNSKDALQLQLLLTCLQNGITEPWQRIPSMVAIFAAEASFILLDASQDHFHAISKLLMRSSKMDLKDIPLFHNFLFSNSSHFKMERLWILKLIHAGLNFDVDAKILQKKSVVELLLSFYASSLSDLETRFLILQIVKKAVKFHALASYLVKHCSLVSWLYTVLLDCGSDAYEYQKDLASKKLWMVLEVIQDVISLRFIMEWLQQNALEMLSNISTYLLIIVRNHLRLLKGHIWVLNTIIEIITSTLRLSQKRKIYQPHFTLSLDGIFFLCQAFETYPCHGEDSRTLSLVLNMFLMNSPLPAITELDKWKLLGIIRWAMSLGFQSHVGHLSVKKELYFPAICAVKEQDSKEVIFKLLRWSTASVILGSIAHSRLKTDVSFHKIKYENLHSLLQDSMIEDNSKPCDRDNFVIDKALANTIFYLQQLLGTDASLVSTTSALSLLLKDAYNLSEEDMFTKDCNFSVALLCAKVHCPAEANPEWRWSYYQPWKDHSYDPNAKQCIEEDQACRTLLIMFSKVLRGESPDLPVPFQKDLECLYAWERRLIRGSG